ncbi:unnamed protein product [Gongylonema pulchrum]|uniref:Uncharacterized protein n=1 Tax=Gongylonema pulchrum TaxID=637853 RepID=A0A183D1C8_9BILA|nr:unnamed protein product [Gongylonema pulchrum]VDK52717.1 unnamed protein product [Gongylonema pulchrum]
MEEEKASLENERQKVLRALEEKHSAEVAAFDDEEKKAEGEQLQHISTTASQFSSQKALRSISASFHSLATNS